MSRPYFPLLKNSDGHAVGFRGINRDITERKRLEAQLRHAQKMEAIGRWRENRP
jgi:PAS domain-containing protein